MRIHLLWHVREDDEYKEDAKLIGTYSSTDAVTAAIARLRSKPGFSDYPAGFESDIFEVDQDHWEEGFISWDEAMEPTQDKVQDA